MKIYILKAKIKQKERIKEVLKTAYKDLYNEDIDLTKIKRTKYGKPYYNKHFHFNISRSKNYICLAAGKSEVGIDIEEHRKINVDISKRILSEEEKLVDSNILNNWCIKESYSKYKGLGLNMSFKKINTFKLLKDQKIHNLSNEKYYCYAYTKEQLEEVYRLY